MGETHADRAATKAELRRRVRARRKEWNADHARIVGDAIGAAIRAWAAWSDAGPDSAWVTFAGLPGEPDLRAATVLARAAGHPTFYPRVTGGRGTQLAFARVDDETQLTPGGFGIDEPPVAPDALAGFAGTALVLVPALAIDRHGRRLGNGGGYYDRLLGELPTHAGARLVIGVIAHEFFDTWPIPIEDHDRRVSHVATERGIVETAPI